MRTQRTTPDQILAAALSHAGIRRTQQASLRLLLTLWLVLPGRHNFTNLARYGLASDRTHRSWAQKPVPWVQLNSALVLQAQDQQTLNCSGILGGDAVFIPKYGSHTPELASYWSGCQGRSVRGLEGSCVTWIDPISHQPIPLSMTQTPALLPAGHSRVDFYATVTLNTIAQLPEQLKQQVQAVVADAYYTKLKFVSRVVDEGQLPFVGKMRKDANLKHLFTRPRTGKPGRPQLYDGKVSLRDYARWDALPWADECMVYTIVAYSVSLKRQVRVVAVVWPGSGTPRMEVLFSTSVTMPAATIITLYRARFRVEEGFLDDKSGLFGLEDSKLRDAVSLERLILVISVATLLLVSEGLRIVQQGVRRAIDPHWKRALSYLKLGLRGIHFALSRGLAVLSRVTLQGGADPAPPGRRKKSQLSAVNALEDGWVLKFRSPS